MNHSMAPISAGFLSASQAVVQIVFKIIVHVENRMYKVKINQEHFTVWFFLCAISTFKTSFCENRQQQLSEIKVIVCSKENINVTLLSIVKQIINLFISYGPSEGTSPDKPIHFKCRNTVHLVQT